MSQSNRGAAQVSLMWVIAFAVIGLGSLGYAFLQNAEMETIRFNEQVAKDNLEVRDTEATDLRDQLREQATTVGFSGENVGRIDLEMVIQTQNELADAFGVDKTNLRKLSDVKDPIIGVYQGVAGERDDLKTQVTALRNDLSAKESASRSAMSDKDATIATLRTEKEDLGSSLQQQISDLERQRDGLRDEFRDMERQLAETRTRNAEEMRALRSDMAILAQRNDILSSRLNAIARRADSPDGTILSVAGQIGRAYIDLGSTDRLISGMEFDVLHASSGAVKGRVRVLNVSEHRAECEIVDQADRYNPIRTDDLISNAVYDPSREIVAVLLGNGFGRYNANDMKSMLAEVGVTVREDVTVESDILLLGTPFFDEETGEMVPWESRDEYKAAQSFSVQVVPLRDWTQWLGK